MAKDKKPSIFSDRGTIGSSDELDEYGVWVKSEPQDLSLSGMDASDLSAELSSDFSTDISEELPGTDDMDFSIPDIDDLPDFDSLDNESPDLELEEKEDDSDSDVFNFGDFTDRTDFDSTELDSAEIDSEELTTDDLDTLELNDEDLNIEEPEKDDAGDFTEISMDDFIGTVDVDDSLDNSAEFSEETSDTSGIQVSPDLQDPVDFHVSASLQEQTDFQGSDDFQISVDFDETADFTETVDFQEAENSIDVTAGINSAGRTPVSAAPEKPAVDLSTQLLMKIAEELSSIRSELSSLKKEFSGFKAIAPTAAAEVDEGGFFGQEDDEKISLTGDELNNILNTADFTEEAGSDAAIELSDDIDMDEESAFSSDSFKQKEPSGFYSGESDDQDSEKLSTADLDMEIDLGDENLELLEGETKLGNSFIEDVSVDELDLSEEPLPDFTIEEDEELKEIREKGAEPMALPPAPEDTEYLNEEALTEVDFDSEDDLEGDLEIEDFSANLADLQEASLESSMEDSIDLSGAVIDEPDLSSGIQDNPLEEPSLEDISISLDLSELDSLEDMDSVEADSADIFAEELEAEEEISVPFPTDASADALGSDDGEFIPDGFVVDESASNDASATDLSYDDSQPLLEEIDEDFEILETEEILEEIEELTPIESKPEMAPPKPAPAAAPSRAAPSDIPSHLKVELKTVLSYMDQLLEALPDDKIEEFARSDYYDTYKKLFKELGLV